MLTIHLFDLCFNDSSILAKKPLVMNRPGTFSLSGTPSTERTPGRRKDSERNVVYPKQLTKKEAEALPKEDYLKIGETYYLRSRKRRSAPVAVDKPIERPVMSTPRVATITASTVPEAFLALGLDFDPEAIIKEEPDLPRKDITALPQLFPVKTFFSKENVQNQDKISTVDSVKSKRFLV